MTARAPRHVEITRDYYDSGDADAFYVHVWGGEDIHIGLYADPGESVAVASRRTVAAMAQRLAGLGPRTRVLDLGAGYGGAARHLARHHGCHVTALNLSVRENARNAALCAAAGLGDRIAIVEGSYEDLPFADAAFDVVWSQDAILHSAHRERVITEAWRVLAPGGALIFTDPMESGRCGADALAPVLARIHLSSMGSFDAYRRIAGTLGFRTIDTVDLTPHLVTHYTRIREELLKRRFLLAGLVSEAFVERALAGLGHWIAAGEAGCLAWGILHFEKPKGAGGSKAAGPAV